MQKISVAVAAQEAFNMIFRRRRIRVEIERSTLCMEIVAQNESPFFTPAEQANDTLTLPPAKIAPTAEKTPDFPNPQESRR